MKIKYLEDYAEELVGFFPQIEEKEMRRILKDLSNIITRFMAKGHKGVKISTQDTLGAVEGSTKRPAFVIKRIFGKKHLNSMKKAVRIRNKKRDKLYGTEK